MNVPTSIVTASADILALFNMDRRTMQLFPNVGLFVLELFYKLK